MFSAPKFQTNYDVFFVFFKGLSILQIWTCANHYTLLFELPFERGCFCRSPRPKKKRVKDSLESDFRDRDDRFFFFSKKMQNATFRGDVRSGFFLIRG